MEIRSDMAPQLIPVSWLLGTWRGVGVGGYPTVPEFRFGQEIGRASCRERVLLGV